jgi:hypothetical protein
MGKMPQTMKTIKQIAPLECFAESELRVRNANDLYTRIRQARKEIELKALRANEVLGAIEEDETESRDQSISQDKSTVSDKQETLELTKKQSDVLVEAEVEAE